MPAVSLVDAAPPLVLALDLGTSSLRAILFDREGRGVQETEEQLRYPLRTTADGGAEVDAPPLFDLLVRCIDGALARAGDAAAEIVAVGATGFWHSLLGLDGGGEPLTPVLFWADTRAAEAARALGREVDAAALLARTGCRPHSSYWPAKLRWLRQTEPEVFGRVARWVSFAEYAALRLHGAEQMAVSVSMASGTGLLDVQRVTWDQPILDELGIDASRLSPLIDVGPAVPGSTLIAPFAARWPALADIPWYPALGDGACANVGSGAIGPGRIALTLGTSGAMRLVLPAPPGAPLIFPEELWAYRLDREHAVIGGALSNGGNLLRWTRELLGAPVEGRAMAAAAAMAPDAHGLTLLPFVAGERAPGWHDRSAGVVAGLTLATRPEHLLRAALEAVGLRFSRIYDALRPLAAADHEIVANGGAIVNNLTWLGIIADALGHSLLALPPEDEATARGAALMALVAAGVLPSLAALPDPAANADRHQADADHHRRYLAACERQERLEAVLYPERD